MTLTACFGAAFALASVQYAIIQVISLATGNGLAITTNLMTGAWVWQVDLVLFSIVLAAMFIGFVADSNKAK